jgi:hypothetical protein
LKRTTFAFQVLLPPVSERIGPDEVPGVGRHGTLARSRRRELTLFNRDEARAVFEKGSGVHLKRKVVIEATAVRSVLNLLVNGKVRLQ